MKANVLDQKFFRQKTLRVAKQLIGCYLVINSKGKIVRHRITETEAYVGPHDLACHSAKGRTNRTEVMFSEAGTLYVYLIYGMYWMLNIVTEKENYPAAVLIRGIQGADGPGKLTKLLGINKSFNGKISSKKNKLWFEKGCINKSEKIVASPRIGVSYAGPIWSKKHYRFSLKLR